MKVFQRTRPMILEIIVLTADIIFVMGNCMLKKQEKHHGQIAEKKENGLPMKRRHMIFFINTRMIWT